MWSETSKEEQGQTECKAGFDLFELLGALRHYIPWPRVDPMVGVEALRAVNRVRADHERRMRAELH